MNMPANRAAYKRNAWVSDRTSRAATIPTTLTIAPGSDKQCAIEGHGRYAAADRYRLVKG